MARKSLTIQNEIFGVDHGVTGSALSTLSDILSIQENDTNEVKELLKRKLAITIKREGKGSHNTAAATGNLSVYHDNIVNKLCHKERMRELEIAEEYCREKICIFTELYGSTHHMTVKFHTRLETTVQILNAGREMERRELRT